MAGVGGAGIAVAAGGVERAGIVAGFKGVVDVFDWHGSGRNGQAEDDGGELHFDLKGLGCGSVTRAFLSSSLLRLAPFKLELLLAFISHILHLARRYREGFPEYDIFIGGWISQLGDSCALVNCERG